MKLLIVTPYYYPKIGGLENYVFNLVKNLQKDKRLKIIIITSNHQLKKYEKRTTKNVTIYRLPIQFKLSNTPISIFWYREIKNIIVNEQPDVINAHSPVPFIADISALAAGSIPFILTYHSGSMKKGKLFSDIVIYLYEKTILAWLFKRSNKIISTSISFINETLNKHKYKVSHIMPGVDLSIFKLPKETARKNTILFVGRIEKSSEWKGIYNLINAFSIVHNINKNITLEFVGSGDAVNQYKKYISNLKLTKYIKFVGESRGVNLVSKLQQAKVLILPSISDAESFGTVLVEAMACGLPVIGSNVGGIPQIIDHGRNGFLVEPGDLKGLAKSILILIEDIKLYEKFSTAARKKVENNFTWEINVNKFNKILNEYINI